MSDVLVPVGFLPVGNVEFQYYNNLDRPRFLALDVAKEIKYYKNKNGSYNMSRLMRMVPDNEKLMGQIVLSGQRRNVWFLEEFGLYEILFRSQSEAAMNFKNRVKTALQAMRINQTTIYKNAIQDLFQQNRGLHSENQLLHNNNVVLENRYTALNYTYMDTIPMQNYYYATRQQDCQLDIGQLATLLSIPGFGRNNLFRYLREHHILMNNNRPYQRYNGEFSVVLVTDESGRRHPKTIVNQDGINRVIRLLSNDGHQLRDIVIPTEEALEERLESIDFTTAQSAT